MKTTTLPVHISVQEAFASTLIHSLWEGALIVFVVWLVRRGLNRQSQINYILPITGLFAIVFSSILTFFYLWNENTVGFYPYTLVTDLIDEPVILKWIDLVWLAGAMIFLIRFLRSHYQLKKLIVQSAPPVDSYWNEIFGRLTKYYCLKKPIVLLQSDKVTSAFLTGVIKPVIIVPTSWVNQLSYKEAECILAHELSHVFNRDHWVNLFIQLSQILYYFNPAVHILISHIKVERELKADKTACFYLGEPILYAKLILKIEETAGLVPAISLPFFQQRKQLKRRIESVLNVNSKKPEFTTGLALLAMTIGLLVFSSIAVKTPDLASTTNKPVITGSTCMLNKREFEPVGLPFNAIVHKPSNGQRLKPLRTVLANDTLKQSIDEETFVYQDFSKSKTILAQLEEELKAEGRQHKTVIYKITRSTIDSNQSLNGGIWELPRQVKCYAPVETKTYIIIRSGTHSIPEQDPEWNTPGRVIDHTINPQ